MDKGKRIDELIDSEQKYLIEKDLDLCCKKTHKLVKEAWENGEDVPKEVVLVGDRKPTRAETERGLEIEKQLKEGKFTVNNKPYFLEE